MEGLHLELSELPLPFPARLFAIISSVLAVLPACFWFSLQGRNKHLHSVFRSRELISLGVKGIHHSIHMKLSAAGAGIATRHVHDPCRDFLGYVLKLFFQLFRLHRAHCMVIAFLTRVFNPQFGPVDCQRKVRLVAAHIFYSLLVLLFRYL